MTAKYKLQVKGFYKFGLTLEPRVSAAVLKKKLKAALLFTHKNTLGIQLLLS